MTTSVEVDKIPNCDFCKEPTPAYADGQTMMGPWANMCEPCFDMYGVGLGLGKGQRLLTKSETVTIDADGEPVTIEYKDGLPHLVPINEEWWDIGCPKDCDCLGFGHNNLAITTEEE